MLSQPPNHNLPGLVQPMEHLLPIFHPPLLTPFLFWGIIKAGGGLTMQPAGNMVSCRLWLFYLRPPLEFPLPLMNPSYPPPPSPLHQPLTKFISSSTAITSSSFTSFCTSFMPSTIFTLPLQLLVYPTLGFNLKWSKHVLHVVCAFHLLVLSQSPHVKILLFPELAPTAWPIRGWQHLVQVCTILGRLTSPHPSTTFYPDLAKLGWPCVHEWRLVLPGQSDIHKVLPVPHQLHGGGTEDEEVHSVGFDANLIFCG